MKNKKNLWDHVPWFCIGFVTGGLAIVFLFIVFRSSWPAKNVGSTTLASQCPQAKNGGVEIAALLPPPVFSEELPDVIEAGPGGQADLAWKPVPKALSYLVTVMDKKGRHINAIKTPFNALTIKDLRTLTENGATDYYVSISTINIDGKAGEKNSPREIVVQDRPDITAPTIKSIRTDD